MATLSNAEVFRAASRQIREDGWYGGPTKPDTDVYPRVCALSAIAATGARQWVECAALAARRAGKAYASDLPGWNNAPERTAEQVIALFDGLAADEELKEQVAALLPAESPLLQDNLHPQPSESSTPREESILPTLKEAVLSA